MTASVGDPANRQSRRGFTYNRLAPRRTSPGRSILAPSCGSFA